MKKFFKYTMMLMAAMTVTSFVACSDDDDEVKSYKLTITLNPVDVDATNINNLKIVVKGTSNADTISLNSIAQQELTLTQGTYQITANGKVIDEATAYVQGSAAAELYADQAIEVRLSKYNQSPLVFTTLHTTGSALYYVLDSYIEIANNSDEVQYLDGLVLANTLANQKSKSAWQEAFPDKYRTGDASNAIVLAFPGTGKDYPLQPGQSVVVADQALNHKLAYGDDESKKENYANSPDLTNANFEKFYGNGDVDNENVPNMDVVIRLNQYKKMWAFGVSGGAYMLVKFPEGMTWQKFIEDESNYETQPNSTSTGQVLMIPNKYVLDAVDAYDNGVAAEDHYPFFLAKDDASGVEVNDMYSGKCIRRKVSKIENGRVYYKDTNNSREDFVNNQPLTPGVTPTAVDN
ncbi:MAG: DUF4876 domain-containing protein [Prevotella sp.]|nr:DUF4876 domain-containing protein [Prevotella sp.]